MNPLLAAVTEKEWQAQVEQLARLNRWRVYHPWTSIRSAEGFPDLTLVRPPRLVFLELKRESGKVRIAQEGWLADLAACGHVARVARPSDWDSLVALLT